MAQRPEHDDDDTDGWVDRLRGAPGPRDAEAEALRAAVRAHAERTEPEPAASDDHAWQQLRFRLRREKLIAGGKPAWRTWAPMAAAAMLMVALGLPVLMQPGLPDVPVREGEAPTLRGGSEPQQFTVGDPLRTARKVAGIAARQNGRPVVYFHDGIATVDFEWNAAAAADDEKDLKRELPQADLQPGLHRFVFRRQP